LFGTRLTSVSLFKKTWSSREPLKGLLRFIDMNARELQIENARLRELLTKAQDQVAGLTTQYEATQAQYEATQAQYEAAQAQYEAAQTQHAAVTEQFALTIEEKDRQVASLEHQIKLLLQRIKGSRQERIDPDQLLLFSLEELQELAAQLDLEETQAFPRPRGEVAGPSAA
jgi:chromosome segregation ATPase